MTADTIAPPPPADDSLDKALALVSYVILFLALFIAGFPSLISVIIAYVRRGSATPLLRSHYDNQIKIFWVGAVLILLGVAFIVMAAASGLGVGFAAWSEMSSAAFGLGLGVVLLAVAALFAFFGNFLWMIIASIVGLVRLLEGRPIGHVAAYAPAAF